MPGPLPKTATSRCPWERGRCGGVPPRGARPRFWIFLLASAYGVFLEWMQSFEPSRTADFLDWLTDSLGAIFGLNLLGIGLLWTLDRQARRQWIGYFLLLGTLCFLSALAATLF